MTDIVIFEPEKFFKRDGANNYTVLKKFPELTFVGEDGAAVLQVHAIDQDHPRHTSIIKGFEAGSRHQDWEASLPADNRSYGVTLSGVNYNVVHIDGQEIHAAMRDIYLGGRVPRVTRERA